MQGREVSDKFRGGKLDKREGIFLKVSKTALKDSERFRNVLETLQNVFESFEEPQNVSDSFRKVSETFQKVSEKFQKCVGQFPEREYRGRTSFSTVSGNFLGGRTQGRKVSEIFRAISGEGGWRGGEFQKYFGQFRGGKGCGKESFGQFPGKEDRGEKSFRNASEQFHKLFGQFPGREKRGRKSVRTISGSFRGGWMKGRKVSEMFPRREDRWERQKGF